jgi:hypothetical protein
MGQERSRPVVTNHDVARSLALTVEGEHTDVGAALIVDKMLDGHGFRHRFQRLLLRAGPHLAGRAVTVGPEGDVLDRSVRSQAHAEFRKTFGELRTVDVVATGPDAAKENRLDRAE